MARQLTVTRGQVDDWYRRDRIPVVYWYTIMGACRRFGYELTGDDMLEILAGSGHLDPAQRSAEHDRAQAS